MTLFDFALGLGALVFLLALLGAVADWIEGAERRYAERRNRQGRPLR